MKRTATAAAIAAALLLLAGCSTGAQENVAVNSATSAPAAPAESAAPLTAQTPEASSDAAQGSPEAAFLTQVREVLPPDNSIPNATDEQLIAAAEDACAQMAAGADSTAVSVIDGEQKDSLGYFRDSARIGSVAKQTICP